MNEGLFTAEPVQSNRIIYTPSAFARASLFYLQEAGTLHATRPHTSSRQGLASYLCFLVKSGTGSLRYNGEAYPLSAGDCVLIDCQHPYAHQTDPEHLWQLQWIHFNGPTMRNVYEKYIDRGGKPVFSPKDITPYADLLSEVLFLAASDDHIRDMKINEKIANLLTLIMSESWHPDSHRTAVKKQSMQQIKSYLDEHYREHITLDQLAEQFFINKYYLTRVFRAEYGTTILSYLDRVRVSQAKQLLRFTDRTAEEIGTHVGIDEPGYFNRVFKKVEGITPGEYRKMW